MALAGEAPSDTADGGLISCNDFPMDWVVKIVLQRMLVDMTLRHRAAPSSASAPFGATLVDGSRIVIYFSIALLFLSETLL
jgi:hypothetical protein